MGEFLPNAGGKMIDLVEVEEELPTPVNESVVEIGRRV